MAEDYHMQREELRKLAGKVGDCGEECGKGAEKIGQYGIDWKAFTWAGQGMSDKYEEYRKKVFDLLDKSKTVLKNAETSVKGIADNEATIQDDIAEGVKGR